MKIIQIIYTLGSGGAERLVVDLSNELALNGNEVLLFTFRDDNLDNNGFYLQMLNQNIKYTNLKIKKGFSLNNIILLYKLLKKNKPDIVHSHQNLVNYIFPLTFLFKKIAFFHTIHNAASKEIKNKVEFYMRKFFYNYSTQAITISKNTSKSFETYYGTKNYLEIVNGRKKPLKSKNYKDVEIYFNKLKEIHNYVFLHIGRCHPQKNQMMLIKCIEKLNKEGLNIALLIIGAGFENELGLEIKEKSNSNIYFIGEKSNIADYLLNADAFCLSSIHEGMPISLIESFACGCIPICTPVGGIIDSIENKKNGFISFSISESDYLQTLKQFILKNNEIKKESLIQYYWDNFSIEKCTQKHLEIYTSAKQKFNKF
jgi:glycosyltransferase involved in cell wall biosynthesis